jgi:hypothetical protein
MGASGAVFLADGSLAALTPESLLNLIKASFGPGSRGMRDYTTSNSLLSSRGSVETAKPLAPVQENAKEAVLVLEGLCFEKLQARNQDPAFL